MAKAIRVGDLVTLPSGAKVRVTCPGVPERPWAAIEHAWLWHVCRDHGLEAPSASHYFGGTGRPLQLDEDDAKALAEILNTAR